MLGPTRPIQVRCAGLDEDACMRRTASCRSPDTLATSPPNHETRPALVHCPAGQDVIVGSGASDVLVPADVGVAWLDLRGVAGGVRATLPPDVSHVSARLYRESGLSERGELVQKWNSMTGDLAVERLGDGQWTLVVEGIADRKAVEFKQRFSVQGQPVDLGLLQRRTR